MAFKFKDQCLYDDSNEVLEGKGKNIIPPPKEKPLWIGFLNKFNDPIIIILIVVFILSFGISFYQVVFFSAPLSILVEPIGILIALLLATGVGFLFEYNAEKEFKILNRKKDERQVKVIRWYKKKQGAFIQMTYVKRCDVVVGDVVRLESGDEVPADALILECQTLHVDESAYTGEMYTTKSSDLKSGNNEATYPCNMLLRGSTIIDGYATCKVTAVGKDTEEGKGARLIQEKVNITTPLNMQLDKLATWITRTSYIIAFLIIVGRLIWYLTVYGFQSGDVATIMNFISFMLSSIMLAVTLIVVAVPEGLPMSVTISLALSMRRMLDEKNLVRKLHACETMGAATVICTDKTGTLTENKLRVLEKCVYSDFQILADSIAVNSTASLAFSQDTDEIKTVGNPTEGALLYWLYADSEFDYVQSRENYEIFFRQTFTPENKYMVTIAYDTSSGKLYRFVKGAPEIVLDMCSGIEGSIAKADVESVMAQMQENSLRTLGFAYQELLNFNKETSEYDIKTELVFMGVVGMADPIRSDVHDAILQCQNAGVRVIMITGDIAITANKVAEDVGIKPQGAQLHYLTGEEFEKISDSELKEQVLPSINILSRARPTDKARLVTLLQEMGEIVAVTGDGTNDAPALKKAHVGLSMGDGTSIAKEASDITIIDNSFASINTAILWGRSLYRNIQRFILFQMTINICACLLVLIGAFTGLTSPLNVTQMLWVNLIMDTFAAIALSSLPADQRVMNDKPRNTLSFIINKEMLINMIVMGLLYSLFLFGLWQLLWHVEIKSVSDLFQSNIWGDFFQGFFSLERRRPTMNQYELSVFFTFFVIMQLWNLFNARYFNTQHSLIQDVVNSLRLDWHFKNRFSKGFVLVVLLIFVGQVVIVTFFGDMFNVCPLSLGDWISILIITFPCLFVCDAIRYLSNIKNNLKQLQTKKS